MSNYKEVPEGYPPELVKKANGYTTKALMTAAALIILQAIAFPEVGFWGPVFVAVGASIPWAIEIGKQEPKGMARFEALLLVGAMVLAGIFAGGVYAVLSEPAAALIASLSS